MKLQGVNNFCTPQSFGGANIQKILGRAAKINSAEQRLALGVTAMAIQPIIDLKNKKVKPETRKISANRSFAKALVGMATGIVVRGGCIKAAEKAFAQDRIANKLAKITAEKPTRESIMQARDFIKNKGGAKQYAAIIGTIAALGVMLFTNFLIDAPVTNWMTNLLNKKQGKKEENKSEIPQPKLPNETKSFEGLSPINKQWLEQLQTQSAEKGGNQ